ncbi:hypothetical protein [Roseovarius sp.]|uniref:hypothetical protein n=1 Tax=Roseovarius sp. TaxID=1486281 RepID=UPI003A9801D6
MPPADRRYTGIRSRVAVLNYREGACRSLAHTRHPFYEDLRADPGDMLARNIMLMDDSLCDAIWMAEREAPGAHNPEPRLKPLFGGGVP